MENVCLRAAFSLGELFALLSLLCSLENNRVRQKVAIGKIKLLAPILDCFVLQWCVPQLWFFDDPNIGTVVISVPVFLFFFSPLFR